MKEYVITYKDPENSRKTLVKIVRAENHFHALKTIPASEDGTPPQIMKVQCFGYMAGHEPAMKLEMELPVYVKVFMMASAVALIMIAFELAIANF